MSNIIKADFYRIFKDKMFKVLCILTCAITIAMSLLYCLIDYAVVQSQIEFEEEIIHLFGANELVATMYGITGITVIIIPIFVSIILYRDFSNGVIRNKILAGKKRSEIYGAALIENIVLNVGFCLVSTLITLIIGLIFLPFTTATDCSVSQIIIRFILTLVMNIAINIFTASMCCFFINGLRSLPLAIILPYVLLSVAMIVSEISMVVTMFTDPESKMIFAKIVELLNFYAGRDLLFSPLMGGDFASVFAVEAIEKGVEFTIYNPLHMSFFICLPLLLAFLLSLLGIKVFNKKDLK